MITTVHPGHGTSSVPQGKEKKKTIWRQKDEIILNYIFTLDFKINQKLFSSGLNLGMQEELQCQVRGAQDDMAQAQEGCCPSHLLVDLTLSKPADRSQ